MADDGTALLEGLRRGDDEAFTTLVHQHAGRMLATARRLLRSEDDARDAVQEAFISAARSIDGFAGGSQLSTWLHRIVMNAALMRLRSRRRRAEEPIDDLLPRFDAEGYHAAAPVAWETPSDELLERRETRVMVRRCIDRLPERYRTVLLLRDIEELDTQEAADALGVTLNTVKIRLHRARQALRTLLERELAPGVTSGRACGS
jgi:RNA polymerase sigma-70 factor (ECF subfamily)